MELIILTIQQYHGCQLHRQFYQASFSQGYFHTYTQLLVIISVYFNIIERLVIRYSTFVRNWKKMVV